MPAATSRLKLALLPIAWAGGAALILAAGTWPNPLIPGPQPYAQEDVAWALLGWTLQALALAGLLRPRSFGADRWVRLLPALCLPPVLFCLALYPNALGSRPWGAVLLCQLVVEAALLAVLLGCLVGALARARTR